MSAREVLVLSVIYLAVAQGRIGAQKDSDSPQSARRANDLVCGPRCVQFALKWYGMNAGLIDLVRELQWPDLESGSTFGSLAQALQKRGLYTCAVDAGNRELSDWPYPALVHLSGPDEAGHFVVWVPANGPRQPECYWTGLDGFCRDLDPRSYKRSGAVLLTAPVEITDAAAAFRSPGAADLRLIGISAILAVVFFVSAKVVCRRYVCRGDDPQLV